MNNSSAAVTSSVGSFLEEMSQFQKYEACIGGTVALLSEFLLVCFEYRSINELAERIEDRKLRRWELYELLIQTKIQQDDSDWTAPTDSIIYKLGSNGKLVIERTEKVLYFSSRVPLLQSGIMLKPNIAGLLSLFDNAKVKSALEKITQGFEVLDISNSKVTSNSLEFGTRSLPSLAKKFILQLMFTESLNMNKSLEQWLLPDGVLKHKIAVAIAIVQSTGHMLYLLLYENDFSTERALPSVTLLSLGSVLTTYIGERIADWKLGNETSLLTFTSSYLPASLGRIAALVLQDGKQLLSLTLKSSFRQVFLEAILRVMDNGCSCHDPTYNVHFGDPLIEMQCEFETFGARRFFNRLAKRDCIITSCTTKEIVFEALNHLQWTEHNFQKTIKKKVHGISACCGCFWPAAPQATVEGAQRLGDHPLASKCKPKFFEQQAFTNAEEIFLTGWSAEGLRYALLLLKVFTRMFPKKNSKKICAKLLMQEFQEEVGITFASLYHLLLPHVLSVNTFSCSESFFLASKNTSLRVLFFGLQGDDIGGKNFLLEFRSRFFLPMCFGLVTSTANLVRFPKQQLPSTLRTRLVFKREGMLRYAIEEKDLGQMEGTWAAGYLTEAHGCIERV